MKHESRFISWSSTADVVELPTASVHDTTARSSITGSSNSNIRTRNKFITFYSQRSVIKFESCTLSFLIMLHGIFSTKFCAMSQGNRKFKKYAGEALSCIFSDRIPINNSNVNTHIWRLLLCSALLLLDEKFSEKNIFWPAALSLIPRLHDQAGSTSCYMLAGRDSSMFARRLLDVCLMFA